MRLLGVAALLLIVGLALLAAWSWWDGDEASVATLGATVQSARPGTANTSSASAKLDDVANPSLALEAGERELANSVDPTLAAKVSSSPTRAVGRVVSDRAKPVAGAIVFMTSEMRGPSQPLDSPRWNDNKRRHQATTDADGKFAFDNVAPGAVRMAVRAVGFAPLDLEQIEVKPVVDPPKSQADLGDLALKLGVQLGGLVVDARGDAVEGALLIRPFDDSQLNNSRSALDTGLVVATSAADGAFKIEVQAAGPWTLIVHSDEHPDLLARGSLDSPGDEERGLVLRLPESSSIDGIVIAPHGEGDPKPDALVVAARAVTGNALDPFAAPLWPRETKCNADGRFHIGGLQNEAPYSLGVSAADAEDQNRRNTLKTVTAIGGDHDIEIRLAPAIVFRVLLTNARDGQRIEDADTSLSGAVTGGRGGRPFTTDDERLHDGRIQITTSETVPESMVLALDVAAPTFKPFKLENLRPQPGRIVDLPEIKLEPLPGVRVHVVDAATGGSLAGARVTVELATSNDASRNDNRRRGNDRGGARVRSERTAADGIATLFANADARGLACATHDDYAPSELFSVDFATASASGSTAPIEIALGRGGRAEVTVLDAEGAVVSGVSVRGRTIVDDNPPPGANLRTSSLDRTSDSNGLAVLAPLVAGRYRFWIDEQRIGAPKGNVDPRAGRVETDVADGETTQVTLRAAPRSRLRGIVREAGAPLVGAQITLAPLQGGNNAARDPSTWDRSLRTRTDGSGRYEFVALGPGGWSIGVSHPSRMTAVVETFEIDRSEVEHDMVLPLATILGRVHDGQGQALAGARVTLVLWSEEEGRGRPIDFQNWTTLFADAAGEFRMHGVPPNRKLAVRARAPGFQMSYSQPVTVATDETRADVDVVLKPGARLEVVVSGGTPTPRARATAVRLDAKGRQVDWESRNAICNADGVATFDGLAAGRWRVTGSQQRDDETHKATRDVDAKGGETSRVEIKID